MPKIILLMASCCLTLSPVHSEEAGDFNRIKQGSEISLNSFHQKSKTFQVIIVKEPDVGPNYAKVQNLIEALEFEGGMENFKEKLVKSKGAKFILKKNLKLLSDEEMAKFNLQ